MSKISRMEAFNEVVKAMKNDNMSKANAMFQIINDSIASDKKNKTFSEYIELKGKKQELLFKDIIIKEKEQEN